MEARVSALECISALAVSGIGMVYLFICCAKAFVAKELTSLLIARCALYLATSLPCGIALAAFYDDPDATLLKYGLLNTLRLGNGLCIGIEPVSNIPVPMGSKY